MRFPSRLPGVNLELSRGAVCSFRFLAPAPLTSAQRLPAVAAAAAAAAARACAALDRVRD